MYIHNQDDIFRDLIFSSLAGGLTLKVPRLRNLHLAIVFGKLSAGKYLAGENSLKAERQNILYLESRGLANALPARAARAMAYRIILRNHIMGLCRVIIFRYYFTGSYY